MNRELGIHTHTHATICKTDNQEGPAVQHREPYSVLCENLDMHLRKDEHMYMYD